MGWDGFHTYAVHEFDPPAAHREALGVDVGPRDQAEVNHALIGIGKLQRGGLDGIHVTDQVGDRYIGRRQLFGIPFIPVHPADGSFITMLFDHILTVA